MNTQDVNISLTSDEHIEYLIKQAEKELSKIKPEIDYYEECQRKLHELKTQEFKLKSLITSLSNIKNLFDTQKDGALNNLNIEQESIDKSIQTFAPPKLIKNENKREVFMPDKAIYEVKNNLRTKNNLNYEIFKAVVFNSGIATTEKIKNYLIENNITQPKTGKTFEDVELKEISSRANYLVRKELLISTEPGVFRSVLGWEEIS